MKNEEFTIYNVKCKMSSMKKLLLIIGLLAINCTACVRYDVITFNGIFNFTCNGVSHKLVGEKGSKDLDLAFENTKTDLFFGAFNTVNNANSMGPTFFRIQLDDYKLGDTLRLTELDQHKHNATNLYILSSDETCSAHILDTLDYANNWIVFTKFNKRRTCIEGYFSGTYKLMYKGCDNAFSKDSVLKIRDGYFKFDQ
jgi:hypothetical protein